MPHHLGGTMHQAQGLAPGQGLGPGPGQGLGPGPGLAPGLHRSLSSGYASGSGGYASGSSGGGPEGVSSQHIITLPKGAEYSFGATAQYTTITPTAAATAAAAAAAAAAANRHPTAAGQGPGGGHDKYHCWLWHNGCGSSGEKHDKTSPAATATAATTTAATATKEYATRRGQPSGVCW